jgi:hypothetical protein
MDRFTRYRTLLVMFVLFSFVSFFLFTYLEQTFNHFKEPFAAENEELYKDGWDTGATLFISDKYPVYDTKRYSTQKKKINSAVVNNGKCNDTCNKQPECTDSEPGKWYNTCKMTDTNGDCYCQFKRVQEGFTSIIDDILKNTPNLPIWRDLESHNKWSPLTARPNIIPWRELKKTAALSEKTLDIANISFSFWIYFDEALGKTRPYTSIFQISKQNGAVNKTTNPYVQNNSIAVIGWNNRPVLRFVTGNKSSSNNFSDESDLYGGNQIGYNHIPSFVFITIQNNVIRLHVDGVEKNVFDNGYISPPSDDFVLSSGITFLPNGKTPDGISIRDFHIYGEFISGSRIKSIFDYVKSDVLSARGWDQNNVGRTLEEGFSNSNSNTLTFAEAASSKIRNPEQELVINKDVINSDPSFGSKDVVISNISFGLEDTKLRTLDGIPCYRNHGEDAPANYQKHLEYDTYTVYKVELETRVTKSEDATSRINMVLKEIQNGKTVTVEPDYKNEPFKLHIHLKNGWRDGPMIIKPQAGNKDATTFTMTYIPGEEETFYGKMAEAIKCYNKLDHVWDRDRKTCVATEKSVLRTCGFSAPKCENYIATKKWGRCATDNKNNVFEKETESFQIEDYSYRNLNFVALDGSKEEFLEVNIDPAKEQEIMFSNKGTTIAMWFKVDPEIRKNDKNWCRLLDFSNKEWINTSDDLVIAINAADSTLGGQLKFGAKVNGGNMVWNNTAITQVLNNTWHHIVWVLSPETEDLPAQWILYHNGKPLATEQHPYPPQTVRNTKVIGGPAASPVDQFWGPSIAEFKIYQGILNNSQIWKLYSKNE